MSQSSACARRRRAGGIRRLFRVLAEANRNALRKSSSPARGEATPLTASRAIGRLERARSTTPRRRASTKVINALPGVHMVDLGNEQHSMSIRQPITTNAVYQYLEDGVPIRPGGRVQPQRAQRGERPRTEISQNQS